MAQRRVIPTHIPLLLTGGVSLRCLGGRGGGHYRRSKAFEMGFLLIVILLTRRLQTAGLMQLIS